MKNPLEEIHYKIRFHESEYNGFTKRYKLLISLKNWKARIDFAKKKKTPEEARAVLEHPSLDRWAKDQPVLERSEQVSLKKILNSSWSKAHHIFGKTWWRQRDGMGMHRVQWHQATQDTRVRYPRRAMSLVQCGSLGKTLCVTANLGLPVPQQYKLVSRMTSSVKLSAKPPLQISEGWRDVPKGKLQLHRKILHAQIKPNAAKLIGWHFSV